MSTAALTITRAVPTTEATAEEVWIRLEHHEPESAADAGTGVADAADLVDAIFDTDPCDSRYTKEEEEPAEDPAEESQEPPGDEEIARAMKKTFDLALCDIDLYSGTVRSTVHLYQSHPGTPYRLQIEGGTIVSQRRITEQESRFVDVKEAASISLDKPLLECTPSWDVCSVTPQPPITRSGTTLFWGVKCSGRIAVQMVANGDEIGIVSPYRVDQESGRVTAGEVTLYAFCRGASDMLQYTPAEPQELEKLIELREKFCKEWDDNWTFPPTPEQRLWAMSTAARRLEISPTLSFTRRSAASIRL